MCLAQITKTFCTALLTKSPQYPPIFQITPCQGGLVLALQPAAHGNTDSVMALAVSARYGAFRDPLGTSRDNRQAVTLAKGLEIENQAQ